MAEHTLCQEATGEIDCRDDGILDSYMLDVMLQRLIVVLILVEKFTDEQHTTINQSRAGRFDPWVFVNCLHL